MEALGYNAAMRCTALIVAAGRGERFASADRPKQYQLLAGRPLLLHAVDAFCACPEIGSLVVVVAASDFTFAHELFANNGLEGEVHLCRGGAFRQDSVRAGLDALDPDADLVAVHDAARPLVTPALIARVIDAAARRGAAIPAIEVSDTVKAVADGQVTQTIDRRPLQLAQTPQVFAVDLLRRAYAGHRGDPRTDDAQLVEALGHRVAVVRGDPRNIKITVPHDLLLARALLQGGVPMEGPRAGVGYDVHRLTNGDGLVLGGVALPCDLALIGHSDADVLCHAAADALLGAAALGDIGTHFPPDDPRFAGARSLDLLAEIRRKVDDRGLRVGNLDCVVVCQRPRLAPHVAAMRRNLAEALQVEIERVSVKATTTEGLGFAGRSEGIAAYATVLLCPAS